MRPRALLLGCLFIPLFVLASCGQSGTSSIVLGSPAPGFGTPLPCNYATQWRPPAGNIQLNDVAMVSPNEGWAVGNTAPSAFGAPSSPSPAGVIYHFIDGQWVRLPQTYANSPLVSLSMDSPTDGWAFSSPNMSPVGRVVVLHYSLGQWRQVDVPALDEMVNGGGFFMSVSVQMFGPSAGWMFAWTNVSRDPSIPNSRGKVVVLRYENGVWTSVAAPPVTVTTEVFGLSAVSANEAWTVGTDYGADLKVVIAHYVNGAWSLWPKTFAGNSDQSITMFSPTDGWAAYDSNDSLGTVLLHYNGSAWAPVATPVQWTSQRVFLTPLFYAVNSDVTWFWATASTGLPGSFGRKPLIEQYNHGQWEQASWPFSTVMPQALAAGSGNELWAVGDVAHQEGCAPAMVTTVDQGVFLHFQQGHWSEQVLP